jgi:hypothetical protein
MEKNKTIFNITGRSIFVSGTLLEYFWIKYSEFTVNTIHAVEKDENTSGAFTKNRSANRSINI